MNEKLNRRHFVKSSFLGLGAIATLGFAPTTVRAAEPKSKPTCNLKFGCAGYTFVKYSLDDSLKMMKRLNIGPMSLKDFHLPINADEAKIAEVLAKFKANDALPYAVGPIYMKSEQEVTNAFAYANRVGVKMIVAVPNYDLLSLVAEKAKEYDLKVAIHIHGPDTKLFPDATDVWKHIEKLDTRLGICYDIAHTVRSGVNLIEDYKKYHSRIYDMHVRDVNRADKSGHCVEAGRGIINFKEFFSTLIEYKYDGMCSIEYEKDMSDVLPGLAETIGYFRGVSTCL